MSSNLKIAIMQPTFNPWLGYFDLIDYVDTFIFLDTVQLNQQSWQTRNKIKIQDKELMISIPIEKNKNKKELFIKDALIDFRKFDFRKKLLRTIKQNYKKSKHYDDVFDFISELILYETKYLSEYNINIIRNISKKLEINSKILILSNTDYISDTKKGDLVLDICKYFGVSKYVSPIGAKEYLDKSLNDFKSFNIEVEYQHYNHPQYTQIGDTFIPYVGILDLLMNEGFENSKKIILGARNYIKA